MPAVFRDETDALGRDSTELPGGLHWPEGFPEILARCPSRIPRRIRPYRTALALIRRISIIPCGNWAKPMLKYRKDKGGFEKQIGDMAYHQAIREAYPGATYSAYGTGRTRSVDGPRDSTS